MSNLSPEHEPNLESLSEDQRLLLEMCGLEQHAFRMIPGKDAEGKEVWSSVADLLNPDNPTCAPMLERMQPDEIGHAIRERIHKLDQA
jgi:hypothetical protein